MKIVKTNNNSCMFSQLKNGDVFEDHGQYFMKVYLSDSDNNVICLNDGDADYFMGTQNVIPVDHELVIK